MTRRIDWDNIGNKFVDKCCQLYQWLPTPYEKFFVKCLEKLANILDPPRKPLRSLKRYSDYDQMDEFID